MDWLNLFPYTLKTLVRLFAHAIAPSTLGVLARIGIEKLFGNEVANVTSSTSALFLDLPVNCLGCFLMGILVRYKEHLIRIHPDFHHVLGTSLLGSLTTFASWMKQAITMFGSGDWVAALFALALGIETSIFSLYLGMHIIDLPFRKFWNRSKESTKTAKECKSEGELSNTESRTRVESALKELEKAVEISPDSRNKIERILVQAAKDEIEEDFDQVIVSHEEVGQDPKDSVLQDETTHEDPANAANGSDSPSKQPISDNTDGSSFILSDDVSFLISIILPIIIWLPMVFAAVFDENANRKEIWLSASLSPLGTMLRWALAHWNGRGIRNHVKWFPLGTCAANILATTLDASLAGLQARNLGSSLWIGAVVAEFWELQLSMVSAYANEIMNALEIFEHHQLYRLSQMISGIAYQLLDIVSFESPDHFVTWLICRILKCSGNEGNQRRAMHPSCASHQCTCVSPSRCPSSMALILWERILCRYECLSTSMNTCRRYIYIGVWYTSTSTSSVFKYPFCSLIHAGRNSKSA
jgi:fluoride ion exporter CrcB/FEX